MKRVSDLILADLAVPILLFGGLFILYFSVVPYEFTTANNGADGGEFIAAILTGGIPHPSGYPTYLLAGKLFQLLPGGAPFFKGALLSLTASALAASLLVYCLALSPGERSAGRTVSLCAAGLALGTAPLFWGQAVIVEVYGLHAFFTACCILWLLLLKQNHFSKKVDLGLSLLSVITGLGMGNHITILLIFPAMLWAAAAAWRRGFPKGALLKYGLLAAAACILVYLTLPLLARAYPPINWGNPQTLEGFIWLVSGQLYQNLLFALPPASYFQRFAYWASLLLAQFGPIGLFLGVLGAVKSFSAPGLVRWVYLWIFVLYSIFSIGYLTNDSTVYLVPPMMVFALWIGMAARELWEHIARKYTIGKIVVVLFLVLLAVRLPATRGEVDPRKDTTARLSAEKTLIFLPKDAIVVTSADMDTLPLWYYHFGLRWRHDVSLIAGGLANFDWYRQTLAHTYAGLALPESGLPDLEKQLSNLNPARPVCLSWSNPVSPGDIKFNCSPASSSHKN